MSTRDDGGQAFPIPLAPGGPAGMLHAGEPGMTLRDYFAGQAVNALIFAENRRQAAGDGYFVGVVAKEAYRIADAMIIERSKP